LIVSFVRDLMHEWVTARLARGPQATEALPQFATGITAYPSWSALVHNFAEYAVHREVFKYAADPFQNTAAL
jgi:hypothetical protein